MEVIIPRSVMVRYTGTLQELEILQLVLELYIIVKLEVIILLSDLVV